MSSIQFGGVYFFPPGRSKTEALADLTQKQLPNAHAVLFDTDTPIDLSTQEKIYQKPLYAITDEDKVRQLPGLLLVDDVAGDHFTQRKSLLKPYQRYRGLTNKLRHRGETLGTMLYMLAESLFKLESRADRAVDTLLEQARPFNTL